MANHVIRTTLRPDVEITVSDREYNDLLEQGLVYDGTPPNPVADPFDQRVADHLADAGSSTRAAIDDLVTAAATGVQDPYVAGLVGNPASSTAASLRSAAGRQMVVVASAATGTAATDRAMLIQAIADTPTGGLLLLPGASDGTFYATDQALVIAKSITIEGASLTETWKDPSNSGSLNHPSDNMLAGAVIKQATAATDVLRISGAASTVNLRRLGLTFASGIKGTNTGHGINATPPTYGGGGHQSGLISSTWDNVVVAGHDGNHYAFLLLNSMYCTLRHLRGYGGGGLSIECDSFEGNYGNLLVEHLYNELFNAGSAHGVRLAGRVTATAPNGVLNLLTFIRPQINITGAAATAGTQYLWHGTAGAAKPVGVDVIDPDLEGAGGNPIDFGGVNAGTMVRSGGLMNGTPVGGYDRGPGANYQKFTAAGSFKVPNSVTKVRVRAIGGGGGGGGGGAALTSGGTTTQAGGGGGGGGMVADAVIDVTPEATYTIAIGAGGTAGTAGVVNGGAGGSGGNGGRSTFGTTLVRADGGAGGQGGGANSSTTAGGGQYARQGSTTTSTDGIPGHGGPGRGTATGLTATPIPPGIVGGGGGGGANATLGGGGGTAYQFAFPAYTAMGGGNIGAAADANGVAGQAPVAAAYGCGGGGGGGGAPGGTGGAGAAGAAGAVEVWW